MPLEILVPFVVLAVSVIMLVITRSGLSRQARLDSTEAVAARFALDFPEYDVTDVMIADDRQAALLTIGGRDVADAAGLVRTIGDRTTTRLMTSGALHSVVEDDKGLAVRSTDFTWPCQTVRLADPADRARWRKLLDRLSVEPPASQAEA